MLALVVCLSMSMVALADQAGEGGEGGEGGDTPAAVSYDQPLTVTGLTAGDTVKFYQVIKWVGEEQGNVAGWKAVSPYDSVLDEATLRAVLVGTPAVPDDPTTDEDESKPAAPATGITSELAGQLAVLATGGVDGTVAGTTATLNNAEPGMWMALVTPADANTIYNPVFVSADYFEGGNAVDMSGEYDGDAVAKKSMLTLTKTASTVEDTWDDNKPNTTAVGDTVNFTVNTTIPGYGEVYTDPHFVLTDVLDNLALETGTVTVTVPEDLDEGDQYTVTETGTGYTITFDPAYLKTLTTATNVTVTYSAIVTSDAAYAVNQEDNEVYIEYSHNPNNQSEYDMKKDTTQHYTFSIDAQGAGSGETVNGKKTSEVVKIGVDANGEPITDVVETSAITSTETWESPLAGAVFGLFTDSAGTVPYEDKDGNPVTQTTGTDGRMNFPGLDAGTYYLKETKAPDGFVTDTTVHTIVIAAEVETITVTEWWNGSEWVNKKPESEPAEEVTYQTEVLKSYTVTIDNQPTATYTFTNQANANSTAINWETAELVEHPFEIVNTQGVELPSTGGFGTTILYIAGGALVIGAGIALVARRRVAAEQQV